MDLAQLGPYRVERKLGRGGMGTVFSAVDVETGERVAVKVMPPALAGETGFRERFEVEIESLKKLSHPGIVRLLAYGEEHGRLFYSMEIIVGTTLEREIQSGRRYTWREITDIAIELCSALKHAHDRGVVHRDIKPANLLIAHDGRMKLSDFGIARLFGMTRLTAAGGVLGTAEYMSPEQAEGRAITPHCDLYSLGAVIYAMATGRPPFQARSLPHMLHMQRFAEPDPLRRYCAEMPRQIEEIVQRLLQKEPRDRFASAAVLSRHLEAVRLGLAKLERDQGFVLAAAEMGHADQTAADPLAATRVALKPPDASGDVEAGRSLQRLPATSPQKQFEPESASARPSTRFTKVRPDREPREARPPANFSQWIATGVLMGALAATVALGWYLMRPRTAERLYSDIIAALADASAPASRAEGDLREFLARFPNDSRSAEVRGFLDEVHYEQWDRRYRLLLRRSSAWGDLLPVERAYLQALAVADSAPDLAIRKLEAVLTLYADQSPRVPAADRCLEIARRKLDSLRERLASWVSSQEEDLALRLDQADRLEADNPAAARQIRQSVVTLYEASPWAESIVRRAKAGLAVPPPETTAERPRHTGSGL